VLERLPTAISASIQRLNNELHSVIDEVCKSDGVWRKRVLTLRSVLRL
jgi:hypothetical protein